MDIKFPTESHKKAFIETVEFFKKKKEVSAITIVGSVVRGHGSYDADIDIDIFVPSKDIEHRLTKEFLPHKKKILQKLKRNKDTGRFFDIGLHVLTLPDDLRIPSRSWTSGPDDYEINIAHYFVYCKKVFEQSKLYSNIRKRYVPYYNESLRQKRLKDTIRFCQNNIAHIEPYVNRGLYTQALKRMRQATEEFIQALFISKKVYPIDYDKWIKYELGEIIHLPNLYRQLVPLHEIKKLESNELITKGKKLEKLLKKYVTS